jgi:hypothetical protein
MARWKLATAHYLNTNDTQWEYNEANRTTGKPIRVRFDVPRFIDPRDPADWTKSWGPRDNSDGECIVCWAGKGDPSDIVFKGDPTPDMIPVDDEAREVSASFEDRWRYKPETSEISYSQALVDEFQMELANKMTKPVEIPGLQELAQSVALMVQQNAELIKSTFPAPRKL